MGNGNKCSKFLLPRLVSNQRMWDGMYFQIKDQMYLKGKICPGGIADEEEEQDTACGATKQTQPSGRNP